MKNRIKTGVALPLILSIFAACTGESSNGSKDSKDTPPSPDDTAKIVLVECDDSLYDEYSRLFLGLSSLNQKKAQIQEHSATNVSRYELSEFKQKYSVRKCIKSGNVIDMDEKLAELLAENTTVVSDAQTKAKVDPKQGGQPKQGNPKLNPGDVANPAKVATQSQSGTPSESNTPQSLQPKPQQELKPEPKQEPAKVLEVNLHSIEDLERDSANQIELETLRNHAYQSNESQTFQLFEMEAVVRHSNYGNDHFRMIDKVESSHLRHAFSSPFFMFHGAVRIYGKVELSPLPKDFRTASFPVFITAKTDGKITGKGLLGFRSSVTKREALPVSWKTSGFLTNLEGLTNLHLPLSDVKSPYNQYDREQCRELEFLGQNVNYKHSMKLYLFDNKQLEIRAHYEENGIHVYTVGRYLRQDRVQ